MYTIKVNSHTVYYDTICEYYNKNKSEDWNPLERLDRIEGGFQIKLNNCSDKMDCNLNYKQLRWSKGALCTYSSIQSFNKEELDLLYESFCNSLGKDKITKIDKLHNILGVSHRTIQMTA